MANLYWKDSGSQAWEDVLNWWTDDAATTQAANAPWVNGVDSTYLAYDLTSASGATSAPVIGGSYSAKNIGTGTSGICDIINVVLDYDSNIYGGTFSGSNFFNNYSYITSGTFSGNDFNNSGTINGGTFSGDGLSNTGTINDGTFSNNVDNFGTINDGTFAGLFNNATVHGGTFSGIVYSTYALIDGGTFTNSATNDYSSISGGTFTAIVNNNGGTISGGTFTGYGCINGNYDGGISGGTFTGGGFQNFGYVSGGTFSGAGFTNYGNVTGSALFLPDAVSVSMSGGNTILAIGGLCSFGYTTPASGGGSDQMIARLLNLPFFINL